MTEVLIDNSPISGWEIVQTQGLTLIGKPGEEHEKVFVLDPVYEFKPQLMQTPQGMAVSVVAIPLWLLASLGKLFVGKANCLRIAVESLSKPDRDMIANAVRNCEAFIKDMRMAQAGITPAKQMPGPMGNDVMRRIQGK